MFSNTDLCHEQRELGASVRVNIYRPRRSCPAQGQGETHTHTHPETGKKDNSARNLILNVCSERNISFSQVQTSAESQPFGAEL